MIKNHCHFFSFHLYLPLPPFLPSPSPSFLSFFHPSLPSFPPSSSLSIGMCFLLSWAQSNGWRQISSLYFIFSSIASSRHCFTGKYSSFLDITTSSRLLELILTVTPEGLSIAHPLPWRHNLWRDLFLSRKSSKAGRGMYCTIIPLRLDSPRTFGNVWWFWLSLLVVNKWRQWILSVVFRHST